MGNFNLKFYNPTKSQKPPAIFETQKLKILISGEIIHRASSEQDTPQSSILHPLEAQKANAIGHSPGNL